MTTTGTVRTLDKTKKSAAAEKLMESFASKVVGQEKATQILVDILDAYSAKLCDPDRPIGNALFLGPTGSGKTHVVETLAEGLFGNKKALLKIDCAEFQHSHEIAKLIGSPPGYLGHRETSAALTQKNLDQYHTETLKISIVLLDEIEKASDALWSLLLGILDKGVLTLGDNTKVNFTKSIIIMTSNLGARQMADRGFGFVEQTVEDGSRLEQIAISAAKSKFTPEFMNRIQNLVVFQTFTEEQIKGILEIELKELQMRVLYNCDNKFIIKVSPSAKKTLLAEGYSSVYGARHLKRTIDTRIQRPLAKFIASGQIKDGDVVVVDEIGEAEFHFVAHDFTPVTEDKPKEGK